MRLAIIRQRYTPYGGAERFLESALEALLERNVAIALYTREWPETNLHLMEPQIVDPFHIGRLWRDFGFARAVCRRIARTEPDLVQSHERLACCDIFRAGDGCHAVWLEEKVRGGGALQRLAVAASPYHRYVLAMERRMFRSPSLAAVICNSAMVQEEIRTRFGVAESKLHLIYNAVDADVFSPALRSERAATLAQYGIAADALVFLLVGSGYERKGVATLLEAMRSVPPPAHLIVVGRESALPAYVQMAERAGLAGRVTFAGPQQDPKRYFGAADVFVLPTRYDPLPNAALEAMACGLPVVTSTKSGAAELVIAADAGFVCPSRDVDALAGHMRALHDPALRERMGANARRAVVPLSPAAMTLALVLLYKSLLEASVARRRAEKETRRSGAARPAGAASLGPDSSSRPATTPADPDPKAPP